MSVQFGPGMAPTPRQLERLRGAIQDNNSEEGEENEDWAAREGMTSKEFPPKPKAIPGIAPPLHKEVTQIIWGIHWEYQKRILDHIEAASASDRQWIILRRILMAIMTEQLEKTQMVVGQRIRQELYKKDVQDERSGEPVEPSGTV